MSTLLDRIGLLIAAAGNMSRLARSAGMTPSHVATIVRRLKANPSAQLESDTLAKLAQGGAVSLDWLATGEGQVLPSFPSADAESSRRVRLQAERPELDLDDDYPTRKVVVKALRGKVEPALLDALQEIRFELEGEPPERYWYDELIRIKRDRDRALRELGVSIEPEPGDRMPP